MFADHEAYSTGYDSRADAFTVQCAPLARSGSVSADLLLDARGHLVGIDCGGDGFDRLVIMLGPHEAVQRKTSARVELGADRVVVRGARALLPVAEKNPYR